MPLRKYPLCEKEQPAAQDRIQLKNREDVLGRCARLRVTETRYTRISTDWRRKTGVTEYGERLDLPKYRRAGDKVPAPDLCVFWF